MFGALYRIGPCLAEIVGSEVGPGEPEADPGFPAPSARETWRAAHRRWGRVVPIRRTLLFENE
jgi:hypothetical protein